MLEKNTFECPGESRDVPTRFIQKTREGCGCFWGLCGSSGGEFREDSGKIAGKFFPNRQMLQILGFRAPGKANLPKTLGPDCRDLVPTFRAGCFLKSTVPAFSSSSDLCVIPHRLDRMSAGQTGHFQGTNGHVHRMVAVKKRGCRRISLCFLVFCSLPLLVCDPGCLPTLATRPTCYRSLSGPSGPKSPGSVPRGVSGALRAPGSGVSKECPRSVRDTFFTLRAHSRDTFWTLRSPGPERPQRHPDGHSRDTSGPKGPRDSCSRSGGVATQLPETLENFKVTQK